MLAPSSVSIAAIGCIVQTSSPGRSNSVQRSVPRNLGPETFPSPLPISCPSPFSAIGVIPGRYSSSASNRCSKGTLSLLSSCLANVAEQRVPDPTLVGLTRETGLGDEDTAAAWRSRAPLAHPRPRERTPVATKRKHDQDDGERSTGRAPRDPGRNRDARHAGHQR
jgi:hypothetical protein